MTSLASSVDRLLTSNGSVDEEEKRKSSDQEDRVDYDVLMHVRITFVSSDDAVQSRFQVSLIRGASFASSDVRAAERKFAVARATTKAPAPRVRW